MLLSLLSLAAALVDPGGRPALGEVRSRLGVTKARSTRTGTAGRIDWLREQGTPPSVMARVFDALAELGIDPESTRGSVLDGALGWYAWALGSVDPMMWGNTAPLSEIVDWATATEQTLDRRVSLQEASDRTRAWHQDTGSGDAWGRWMSRVRAWKREGRIPSSGEVLLRWPDGVTISRLASHELAEEGEIMGHCVGSYAGKVSSGQSEIYAIRTADGFPVVTLESTIGGSGGRTFSQVKGPHNSPVLARWAPYVRETWRLMNQAWLEAFEAKMAAAKAEGKLRDLGIESWRDEDTGWSMVELHPDRYLDIQDWLGLRPLEREETVHRVLLDPAGTPAALLSDHIYAWRPNEPSPRRIVGPFGQEPSMEAKDAYLSWWVPKFRREGLSPYPFGRADADSLPMNRYEDGIYRVASTGYRRAPYGDDTPTLIPANSSLLWMHRGHPLFALAILEDLPSAFAFARFVDNGSMPDTLAVFDRVEPHGMPTSMQTTGPKYLSSLEDRKSEWARHWFQEVDRERSKGTVRAWALWKLQMFRYFLSRSPDRVTDPELLPLLLGSEEMLAWVFQEEQTWRSSSMPIDPEGVRTVFVAKIAESSALRAAVVARPYGAIGVAKYVDGAPRADTLDGVCRWSSSGYPALRYWEMFYLPPSCFDLVPASLKEALVAACVSWLNFPRSRSGSFGIHAFESIRIPVRKGRDELDYRVLRAGERAFITEASQWSRQLGITLDRAPVLSYAARASIPEPFIAAVRAKVPMAFFRAEDIPWVGSAKGRILEAPDLSVSTREQKTKKGSLRQAAREARLQAFPRRVYWPARGFPVDSGSRLFVPPAVPTGWPVSPTVHLPHVTTPAEGVQVPVDDAFVVASLRTWWGRLSAPKRASIRVELNRLRPTLAALLEGSPTDLAAAPLEEISGDEVPLRHLGLVWVGVTPMDALAMAHTTRAVDLDPRAMPILGMFPMAAHRPGCVGYALVLPAGFGAFGPLATTGVYSSTDKV